MILNIQCAARKTIFRIITFLIIINIVTGACDLNGLLYVCGGYDGASCLSDVQRYDPLTGEWTSCPTMSIRRRYCRVAVVGMSIQVHLEFLNILNKDLHLTIPSQMVVYTH